ncbi:MAG: Copper binding protein plastocyanin/azurin family [Actinomycetota bacterium]
MLVDYKADEFASSFLSYFPKNVIVHPGDTVHFKQTWTGEPHSVTMGVVIDKMFKYSPIFTKYENEDDARAHGVPEATLSEIHKTQAQIPGMTDVSGSELYQPGARPCFIAKLADVPNYEDANGDPNPSPSANCPRGDAEQPAFTGRQALYNSGYIPWQGNGANEFVVKIAPDATPGTYKYFCNYHWIDMSGSVKIVGKSTPIPSNNAVNHEALRQIRADVRKPLAAVRQAKRAYAQRPTKPLAGADTGEPFSVGYVSANEFFPSKGTVHVGEPVTWSFKGMAHTVSFHVPAYFPVLTVDKKGDVQFDKRARKAVRWHVPEPAYNHDNGEPIPRAVDVGSWDGTGGFHSSGLLNKGETFTLRFTKPGTYPYACAIHPLMIGQVVVTA